MQQNPFEVTFWGVRGSIPTPLITADVENKVRQVIDLMKPEDAQNAAAKRAFFDNLPFPLRGCFGGNSSCVQVDIGGLHLVFDAGSGIRELGRHWMTREFGQAKGKAHIFISHTHADHILGLPFFVPIYIPGNHFTFYGAHKSLRQRLERQQQPAYFPIAFKSLGASIDFVDMGAAPSAQIGAAAVSWFENDHPGKSFSYRVDYAGKSFIYATDAEYKKIDPKALKPAVDFFKDADLLVFDSQYTFMEGVEMREDWGHSSALIGIDIALAANVKRLAFFHHEPTYDDFKLMDILRRSQKYLRAAAPGSPLEIFFAHEGKKINLLP